MRFEEFGRRDNPAIVLIHGAQVPWEVWQPQIEHFHDRYRVIIPVLPGHDPLDRSTFESVQKTAEEIEQYLLEQAAGEVCALCGQSLGGAIASVIWARGAVRINHVFLESAPLVPQPKLLTCLMTRQYVSLLHKVKQRDQKTLRQAEASFLPKRLMPAFLVMMDTMTDESVKGFVGSIGGFRLPTCSHEATKSVQYYYGTSMNEILAKKSARLLKKRYPVVKLVCLEGYGHCEMSLYRPGEYCAALEALLSRNALGEGAEYGIQRGIV